MHGESAVERRDDLVRQQLGQRLAEMGNGHEA
jgi:hypothetical protein